MPLPSSIGTTLYTWHELTIAFVTGAGPFLPVWIGNGRKKNHPYTYASPKVQAFKL